MKLLTEAVQDGKIVLADGAWGTQIYSKGFPPGDCIELWNIKKPEIIEEIAQSYVAVGCDVIGTNTFGASSIKLKQYGLENLTPTLNTVGAQISREMAGDDVLVMGTIGPTGKILMTGDFTEDEILGTFAEQVKSLLKGKVNAIDIETFTALDEALLAIKVAKHMTGLDIICSFTFDKTVSGEYRTMMGVSIPQMVEAMYEAEVDIIGSNCGSGIDNMIEITGQIREAYPTIPIKIHSNAGKPELIEGEVVYPETPEYMASKIPDLIEAGANIIGGCCGTTPEHIAEFKKVIDKYNQK